MDYKGGAELWKYQWDLVHDPETILFSWSQDESEGAAYSKDRDDIWCRNLNQIICDKLNGRTTTVIDGLASVLNVPSLTFNGIGNINISIPGYITGNKDKSIDISVPEVSYSDDKNWCSVRFPVNGTGQMLAIKVPVAKSKELVDLFAAPNNAYFAKLVEAIPAQESQEAYKKLVQLPGCGYSQISAQNALKYLGWIAGELYVNDPQEEIVVNLLRHVRDRKGLYNGLYGNPYLVGKLFSACDGENRQAFVNEIIKLCDENWTSPPPAQGTVFIGRVPNSFPQFYTGMEFITHCLAKEGSPTCEVRNYIGRFPNGPFDWGHVQDFGATLLKKELNPLDPVRVINSGKEEESLFPVIYPTYLSQEKGNTELTGQFTATLNYIGVTSAVGIIGNGSRLVQALAWTDVVKTGLDALFNNPRVVSALNATTEGQDFLYFWQIASVTVDVATISTGVLEGIAKRGASASNSLKAAGQTEAANKVERLALEAKRVLAQTGDNLLTSEGKFIDNVLEGDYQKYIARKTSQGKVPRERLEWKETRDYWLNDSPIARGNAFNDKAKQWYNVNELNLENGKRLDSYVQPTNGKAGEIISRKATNLEEIELSTFETYLKEMQSKYALGTKIRSNKYPDLNGDLLQGKQILEIPESNQNFSQIQQYIDLAKNKYNIEIRFRPE